MFSKIKLGLKEWKKVEEELERISSGEQLELVINLALVATKSGEGLEEEQHHGVEYDESIREVAKIIDEITREEHHHGVEYNEFIREVTKIIDEITRRYKVEVHPRLHTHHGNVMFAVKDSPKNILKTLRDVLEYVKLECEKCTLHTLDGEFHIGADLAGLYFGDLYKLTMILPGEDGRRLKVHEVHL